MKQTKSNKLLPIIVGFAGIPLIAVGGYTMNDGITTVNDNLAALQEMHHHGQAAQDSLATMHATDEITEGDLLKNAAIGEFYISLLAFSFAAHSLVGKRGKWSEKVEEERDIERGASIA